MDILASFFFPIVTQKWTGDAYKQEKSLIYWADKNTAHTEGMHYGHKP